MPAPAIMLIRTASRLTLLAAAALATGGCAALTDYGCKLHATRVETLDQSTHYRRVSSSSQTDGRPLTRSFPAQAPIYRLTLTSEKVPPCTMLSVKKELVLARLNDRSLIFKETRAFYAEDGTLITTLVEDLSAQLVDSGTYRATFPLPIPRTAPAGKYRIVSRLTLERAGERRMLPLAQAEVRFQIVPR
ncbi:MAG TPA: hypothetical protein VGA00_07445 [Acidiferrobacterales bacterium]